MRFSKRWLGLALAGGALSIAVFAWRQTHVPGATLEGAAGAVACSAEDACAHALPKDHAAAPRLEGRPRMLVFTSHSCPACKRMGPIVKAAITACDGASSVTSVDFDEDYGESLAATYGVTYLPSFVTIDAAGYEVARLTGTQSEEQIERALEEVRGVRCALVERDRDASPT